MRRVQQHKELFLVGNAHQHPSPEIPVTTLVVVEWDDYLTELN